MENDLDEVMHQKLSNILEANNLVEYLQKSKYYNMVELVEKLTDDDCYTIFNSYNFACLKEVSK